VGFDSTFKLNATEKHICIKNAADVNAEPGEIDQLQAFADFIDPPNDDVDEEWKLLEDWEPQEITISVKYLDTYGMMGDWEYSTEPGSEN
jgi:hypothetical protein